MSVDDGQGDEEEVTEDGTAPVVIDRSGIRRPGLRPFRAGDPRAIEAGRRGAEIVKARRAASAKAVAAVAAELRTAADSFRREDLGAQAAVAAQLLIARVVAGEVPIRNADDAATLLRALVDVARLESGQATSQAVVAHLGTDAAARVLQLQQKARVALGQGVPLDSGGVEG